MRSTRLVVSLVAAITLSASAYPLEAQGIGGLIKKKAAEAVKPKDAKKAADTKDAEKPKDDPNTSNWEKEGCGPITPDRLNDLLRGLETERTQRAEFGKMFSSARTSVEVQRCRNDELMSPTAQKIMNRSIPKNATNAQLTAAMEKNQIDLMEHMDKKCGKDRATMSKPDAYRRAHSDAAKAAAMDEKCYDKLKEIVLGFCNQPQPLRDAASQNGLRAPGKGSGEWVFTPNESKALNAKCAELVPLITAIDAQ